MENISKHITYNEAIHSSTAKRLGIDNVPDAKQLENMKALAENIFEPLRLWVGGAIKVNSFFRSEDLNKAIGGASRSQHMCLMGASAIDIDDVYGYKTNKEMFEWIKLNCSFDQLIHEFGEPYPNGNPSWVHVSYVDGKKNRNRCLVAEKEFGKTVYKIVK
jgi:zinc D-Ala-D-Ala carboxypeptidase